MPRNVFLVCGDDKASAVRSVFQDDYDPKRLPAQDAAASRLPGESE
jgi:hypothetical protein